MDLYRKMSRWSNIQSHFFFLPAPPPNIICAHSCYCKQAVQKYCMLLLLLSPTALFHVQDVYFWWCSDTSWCCQHTLWGPICRFGACSGQYSSPILHDRAQSVSEHHPFFSGKDGSGQGQITDKEKKKQAIQKYCCNNNYMLTKCYWRS